MGVTTRVLTTTIVVLALIDIWKQGNKSTWDWKTTGELGGCHGCWLVPCVTRSSAVVILTTQDKQVFVFYEEGFQPPTLLQCRKRIKILNYPYVFSQQFSPQGLRLFSFSIFDKILIAEILIHNITDKHSICSCRIKGWWCFMSNDIKSDAF